MIPQPPTSTLFPYTTLFRSSEARKKTRAPSGARAWIISERTPREERLDAFVSDLDHEKKRDRKSTRLNSSHRCISYAVFCLKKKKKKKKIKKKLKKIRRRRK